MQKPIKKGVFKVNISVPIRHVNINEDDLLTYISTHMTNEQIIHLIKRLDLEMENYDTTRELMDYFVREVDEENKYRGNKI